jgi:hypothetical protein
VQMLWAKQPLLMCTALQRRWVMLHEATRALGFELGWEALSHPLPSCC